MPDLRVFIVISLPEHYGMIPRAYDTLLFFGQQDDMDGQLALIKNTM